MPVEEKNHSWTGWTIHGSDPEGVEVPEYLTIAKNHLATRNIPLKEKDDGNLFQGLDDGILLIIFAVIIIWGTFLGIAFVELVLK